MLQTIKEEFISNLHSVKWMDDVTKKRAVQKVCVRYIKCPYLESGYFLLLW